MRSLEVLVCQPRAAPSSIGDGLAETDDEKLHDAVQKPNTHRCRFQVSFVFSSPSVLPTGGP